MHNAQPLTKTHNTRFGPHTKDFATTGCYDIDTAEQRVMIHSAGLPPSIEASPDFKLQNAEVQAYLDLLASSNKITA